jgi:hypothetical protein
MYSRTQARVLALTIFAVAISLSAVAEAHFNLTMPPPAETDLGGGKGAPPCGPLTPASNVVTPVQGGHPLTVAVTETVLHPGHYRFALSINSRAELPADPTVVVANGLSVSAPVQNPAVFPVLADGVFDHTTGTTPIMFQTTVMLPNITCAKCTLQVIEFMAMHGLNTFPGGGTYYYHHCADLQITADPNLPGADAGTTTDASDARPGDAGADARGTGGSTGAGGRLGTGGTTATGVGGSSAGAAGSSGTGVGGSSAGVAGSTGTGTGGSGSGAGGSAGGGQQQPTDNGACSCATSGRQAGFAQGGCVLLALGLLLTLRRRRR